MARRYRGFVVPTVMFMMVVLLSILSAYFTFTRNEQVTLRYWDDSTQGFYTAEAGLNLRADEIRQSFLGYNLPTGTGPSATNPCTGGNTGSGNFACRTYANLGGRDAVTYVIPDPTNPTTTTIPAGERFQYLNAIESRYTAYSNSRGVNNREEALLELKFKSRLVPMFQFAAFYDKDLEILPGQAMTLNGPVHVNGDLYLNTDSANPGLQIQGQVTVTGDLWRGRKNQNTCLANPVYLWDRTPPGYRELPRCTGGGRMKIDPKDTRVTAYDGMLQIGVERVNVPAPEELDPTPGKSYWDYADLRLVLRLDAANNPITNAASPTGVVVRNPDNSQDDVKTTRLNTICTSAVLGSGRPVSNSYQIRNWREGNPRIMRTLDVDMLALLNCMHMQAINYQGRPLNDTTQEGLVVFLTVEGPLSLGLQGSPAQSNFYAIRVRNGQSLQATSTLVPTPPKVKGLTLVSDQSMYVQGNYNSTSRIPAAFIVDNWNVLSNNWSDANSSNANLGVRVATNTTVNAAVLTGTDTTGNVDGVGGQNGAYNGGLENFPRLHENWTNITFTYQGSMVSLGKPRRVNGAWQYGGSVYNAPNRVWSYDSALFNNSATLPPMTPRFVYLRQELFVRDFDRS